MTAQNITTTKRITANIPAYVQSIVDLEDKIRWAKTPDHPVPKGLKYPTSKAWRPTARYAFLRQYLP